MKYIQLEKLSSKWSLTINVHFNHKDYKPSFSGHETFPLRYGWLKKAYDRVHKSDNKVKNRADCWSDDAIGEFGVGKNMVASIRHWAKVMKIIEEKESKVFTTKIGNFIFNPKSGHDPYLEHPSTLWLIHWQLATNPNKTTWYWLYNHFPNINFDRDGLVSKINRLINDRRWSNVAVSTIKKDVACFIRTYVAQEPSGKVGHDDALESPLTELGLIRANNIKDSFRFVRGSKPMLAQGIFTYALIEFWTKYSRNSKTISFEAIAHAPGSPGRVFLLDENELDDKLATLDSSTKGEFTLTETSGLKQISSKGEIETDRGLYWLKKDYLKSIK
ncbi:MAG: DUF4007 family protein [Rhodobacteraceae bacterium]|nr:DUF4007 family protein [Paracoccaceae bacterium]